MLGEKALDEIRRQKEALLQESSLNRLKLQAELRNLRAAANPLNALGGKVQNLAPWITLLAPAAGFLLARRRKGRVSFVSRVASIVKMALPVYKLWRRFSAASGRSAEPPPLRSGD